MLDLELTGGEHYVARRRAVKMNRPGAERHAAGSFDTKM
jgi:hypothetical protein